MESILDLLEDKEIFGIELRNGNNDRVWVFERCDYYFETTLTKQQLSKFIEELSEIRDKMI